MNEIKGRYFTINGLSESSDHFDEKNKSIHYAAYEVIRIIKGIPLFCEDHYQRMSNSLSLLQIEMPIQYNEFERQLKFLANKNEFTEGNIKINFEEQTQNFIMHFIPHYYPDENDYRNGVKTGFFHAERINPHIKTHLSELKSKVNEYIENTGYFEVFYVDRDGIVTEGSRSNVFFIRSNKIYTCVPDKVLLGVTRQKIIECLKNINIPLIETNIKQEETALFESVFLSGTSPKILPVVSIDNQQYSCNNSTMLKAMDEYNRMISDYIDSKQ